MKEHCAEKIYKYLESQKEVQLNELIRLSSIPSVGTNPEGLEDCRRVLVDLLRSTGMRTEILETPTVPAIFAELKTKQENMPTVLFYGHYDVMPAEPVESWNTPPFTPTIVGDRLFGRGTADNKGQFMAHLMAIRACMEVLGDVPVNVKIILDGEEESGSPSLEWIAETYGDLLRADLVYVSDSSMYSDTVPLICYGNRGDLSFDIDITTAETDNHSGNKGGVIENAAWKMVKLLSSMVDEEGHVTIDGFYDTILPVSSAQEEMMEKLDFDPETLCRLYGVKRLKFEDKKEHYRHLMFLPTFTINGLVSGYGGEGSKTIIPCHAKAKIDIRLVQGQKGLDIYEKVRRHAAKAEPDAVFSEYSSMEPSVTEPSLPIIAKVRTAIQKAYQVEPVNMPVLGASLPNYVFTDVLKVPTVSVPYGNPDENNHAPNENMKLSCYFSGIRATAQVLLELAEVK